MDMVFKSGLMAQNMKVTGSLTKHMDTAHFFKFMVMSIRANGKITWSMGLENTII